MKRYHLLSDVAADADIEAAFEWYESEQPGLGLEFLEEIRDTYTRIFEGPFKYQELRSEGHSQGDFPTEFSFRLRRTLSSS